jgi:hypothetical protein
MDNNLIPRSTLNLISQEREKMLNSVVKMIGSMSENVMAEMSGDEDTSMVVDVSERPSQDNVVDIVNKSVEKALDGQLKSLLHDVDYRISVLQDLLGRVNIGPSKNSRIVSSDLNLAHHMLDGYTFTNNSPAAGSIAWAGAHVVYKGTDYTIPNGNTNLKYVWWDFTTPTAFQASATKPALTADDILVAVNEGGIAQVVVTPGKMLPGGALLDGAISSSELGSGAVTNAKLAALAVLEGNIGSGAVTNTKIGSNAVDSAKLSTGAVTAGKIADGGVSASTQFASGVVNTTALGANAVTTDKIGDAQITGPKIGAGAVAENKLNIAQHLLY